MTKPLSLRSGSRQLLAHIPYVPYRKLPTWADSDHVYAVVETPRGSRAKLEFDPKLGAFTLAKPLLAGTFSSFMTPPRIPGLC